VASNKEQMSRNAAVSKDEESRSQGVVNQYGRGLANIITNIFAPSVLAVPMRKVPVDIQDVQHSRNVCQPQSLGLNLSCSPILRQPFLQSVTGSDKSE
jgi:hypothetical protein